jgi:hypothetical protein
LGYPGVLFIYLEVPADLKKSPGKTEKDSDVGKIGWLSLATGVAMKSARR